MAAVDPAAAQTATEQSATVAPVVPAPVAEAPVVPETAPADPIALAVASQLVDGVPNADLVEAVRQVLASDALKPASVVYPEWRLGFPVEMHLHLDRDEFAPGELAFVTEDEFDTLQKAKVFAPDLDWEDGELPQETSDGEG
ncbi:MAG: hypothetical protein ACRED4_08500 [Brevundimonas sp.]